MSAFAAKRAPLLAVVGLLAGCDTFFGEGERVDVGYQEACFRVAEAHCAKLAQCNPLVIKAVVADRPCVERLRLQCQTKDPPPGSNQTSEMALACARGIATLSCEDHILDLLPATCSPAGKLALAQPCSWDTQCATGYCLRSAGSRCGACATPAAAGASCATSKCAPGLSCNSGICATPVGRGMACGATIPCKHGLYCNGATCAATQTTVNAACNKDNAASCSIVHGVYCHPQMATCQTLALAAPGGMCGKDPSAALCPLTFACTAPANVCPAVANDGEACDANRLCVPPADCVAGVCRLATADACPG